MSRHQNGSYGQQVDRGARGVRGVPRAASSSRSRGAEPGSAGGKPPAHCALLEIGSAVLQQQAVEPWGTGAISRLADDLHRSFPEMTGLSRSNLQYMRAFADAWAGEANVPRNVGHLPWGHVRVLLDKLDERGARDWYAAAAVEHGWSRDMLLSQIKNRTLERATRAISTRKPCSEAPRQGFRHVRTSGTPREPRVIPPLRPSARRRLLE